jgi:hypothetical protein
MDPQIKGPFSYKYIMRFEQFINESYEAAEEQWNKDIKEIYSWVKSLENDRVIIEYRKQNNRCLRITYKTEQNEYPILDLEDIFLTPDYVRILDADGEPLLSRLDFVEYSINLDEKKYTKNFELKLKQWKQSELQKLTLADLKKKIADSIKQVDLFCKKR